MSEVIWISSDSERFSDSSSDFEREMVEAKRRSLLDCGQGATGFKTEESREGSLILLNDEEDNIDDRTGAEDVVLSHPTGEALLRGDEEPAICDPITEHDLNSSDGENDDSAMNEDKKYLHNDPNLPIYDIRNSGCTYSEAVKILLNKNESLVCHKQPILVENNYMFLVNLSSLDDPDDIKSDDCGHWVHKGRKSTTVAVEFQNKKVAQVKKIEQLIPPDENSSVYTFVRTYYAHDPYNYFKRIFYHIFDAENVKHPLCLVQYFFDKKSPHKICPRSHGNSKSEKPYARCMKSLHNKLRDTAGKTTPKQTLSNCLKDCGGVLEARSLGSIPKSRSQVRYHQAKNKEKSSESDSLFTVMLQCKSTDPNSDEAFVRSVVAAPEPMAVLATNRQLKDMVRFLTDPQQHTVMGIDPTFNFGEFNVTPIAFRYLLLEHRKEGHSPIMLGPLLVHQQKKFSSYHFFASTLVSLCPSLRSIKAFGSDGETALYQAFHMQLPEATHLRCFRHFRANLVTKLTSLGLPSEIINQYMKDVFGKTTAGVHEVGLVDMTNEEGFEQKLKSLHKVWDQRELSVVPHRSPVFFDWFVKEKSVDVKDSMLLPLREAAGLGSPPSPFYTNTSESLNNMLHAKVQFKKSQWHEFNQSMKELIKESYNLVELAVIDSGDFKFKSQYQDLVIPQSRWFKMTLKQRQHHLSKVSSAAVKECDSSFGIIDLPLNDLPNDISLSISVDEAQIQSVPKEVLSGIWGKAKELISIPGKVVEGPCSSSSNAKCYVVASKSSVRPHIVQHNKSGQFTCDSSCPMWQSSKICAHCIAAAEFAHCLGEFILWYNKSKSKPNFHKLSKMEMPKGTGRKGEKPPRKKKRGSTTCHTLSHQGTDSSVDQESMPAALQSSTSTGHPTGNSVSNQWRTPSCDLSLPRLPVPPNPWMHMPVHQNPYAYPNFASPQIANDFSFNSPSPFSSQMWNVPPSGMQQQTLTHPFFVRFLVGNIRVCQGCRGSLRLPDGSVCSPPNDIVVARLERRPYFDKSSGMWCQPQKETNSHYHLKLSCVVKADPLFVPSTLQVSTDLNLLPVHLELISTEFGVTFNE